MFAPWKTPPSRAGMKRNRGRRTAGRSHMGPEGTHKHRWLSHLVWIPKYRRRMLRGKVTVRLRHDLYEACKIN